MNARRTNSRHVVDGDVGGAPFFGSYQVVQGPDFATYFDSMVRLPLVVVVIFAVSAACGSGEISRQSAPSSDQQHGAATLDEYHKTAFPAVVPENAEDRGIRRNLNLAIAQDPSLKDRQISFLVSNGDVSVTGIVKSEDERKKMNELAMNIAGVKSVANALRISE